nr:ATP-binding sensor histidine kinase [Phormidium sp. LEGE 05292]
MDNLNKLLGKYRLTEALYAGERTLVYRGVSEAENTESRPVVLKLLRQEYPTFNDLLQFRNQYTIAKNLNISGIVRPYSLETYQNGYVLVMEDYGGISLRNYAKSKTLSLLEALEIAQQLATILHEIHGHRVIHKDIKPANILINPGTNQVKLIDFSIASLLPKETQEIKNPHQLEGTLTYLAPEQTGRMNRGIDYRADFYALGVTLFELLTGKLPFECQEVMELLHCHLAQEPPKIHYLNSRIPPMVSAIVNKLMAKNAEERYQSALGLKYDLEICVSQLKSTGQIVEFPLAQRDISDKFIIPEKLYGREQEVKLLLEAFENRVANGTAEMMLVAGFSGIGKTAVINEVHKPITRQQGYFIKGKFDQFNRNIPFSAFLQALRDLMGQLLSESDAQLAKWRSKILAAVGENGQVLIEVIPELETIIGKQPSAPELSGTAVQNRFNLLFQKFIGVLATPEHPLVMFLDDLQWADSASLQLVKLLMEDQSYLLLLGAYRDNEVQAAHPLILTVEALKKAGKTVNTITLVPLNFSDTNQLVADTLLCSTDRSHPLTELIDRKTKGNPFFTTQFLKALYEDGQITFNREQGYWECDIAQINALSLTQDVVEFMATQLQKLPSTTQEVLKLAACIGNQFDLDTLAIISEQSPTIAATALWKALQEGLILPTSQTYKFFQVEGDVGEHRIRGQGDKGTRGQGEVHELPLLDRSVNLTYRFLHDRVQQAAYSLIPEDQKLATHLAIGQLLYASTPETELETNIFEIVNHFNTSIDLITEADRKHQLAQLNLIAGRKAKATIAYHAAVNYFTQGIDLLPTDAWIRDYQFTLTLHHERLEAACLNTDFDKLRAWGEEVLQFATSLLDTIKVYETRMTVLRAQGKSEEIIETGLEVLKLLGVAFPEQPTLADIGVVAEQTRLLWQERSPLSLLDLPVMSDPYQQAAMQILTRLVGPSYIAAPTLLPLLVFKQIELSIKFGNSPVSIVSYADYGLILCSVGDLDAGYGFGQLSLNLLEKLQATSFKSRAYYIVNCYIRHWKEPLNLTLPFLLEGYQAGLETGDWDLLGLNSITYTQHSYWSGRELSELAEEMEVYGQAIDQLKQELTLQYHQCYQQTILNLLGQSEVPYNLQGKVFNASSVLTHWQKTNNQMGLFHLFLNQAILSYLFGQYEQAATQSAAAEQYKDGGIGQFVIAIHVFYDALIHLARYKNVSPEQQSAIREQVNDDLAKLQNWASYAPFNHQHRSFFVEAEMERIWGKKAEAIDLYDRAITVAKKNGYVQEEALGNELAAKFYLEWGKEKVAAGYMQEAYYCYARWGALAKINDLEKHYPELLKPILLQQQISLNSLNTILGRTIHSSTQTSSSSSTDISTALDFAAILKASQVLSSEIQLEKLVSTLMQVVMENAGAKKAALLMFKDGSLELTAIGTTSAGVTLPFIPCETSVDLPIATINTVKRNYKTIVLNDAIAQNDFMADPYLIQQQPKSVLCAPILNQGKLVGLLYLENKLTAGVFTAERLEVVQLLCSQAAISLENARLYQELQAYSRQLEQSLEKLRVSEARFQKLADNIPGLIYQIQIKSDGSASTPYVSSGCQTLYEVTAEELISGKYSFRDFEHPDDSAQALQVAVESAQNLTPFRHEWRIVTKNGTVKWVQAVAQPERQEDGEIVWDGMMIDITEQQAALHERKRAEQELAQTMQELQQAQLLIVQSEKMSALGNLIAGVAHEMNNPLGFITATLQQTQPILADITEHLNLYQETLPNPSTEILDHAEEIELDYNLEDLPKMIDGMLMACDRLRNISTSLRTFSRADRDYKVPFNIHEGIDSTILILKHRLKANEQRPAIEVITDYGNLPPIECFPGQLNQVFMNILANAIDALDESNIGRSYTEIQANPNQIKIITSVENQQVKIIIADNGKGITEEVKQKIFDQFFTTKTVGKGTGLGLAIARQIVEKTHEGQLCCNSVVSEGTEFIIHLPILSPCLD